MSKLTSWISHRWGDGPSMSGLKSSIKGTGHFVGNIGQYAAPIIAMSNPLLGAGIMALSKVGQGKRIEDVVKDAALTGATGYALGHAGDALGKVKGFFGSGSDAAGEAAGEAASGAASAARAAAPLGEDAAREAASMAGGAAASSAPVAQAAPGFFSKAGHALLSPTGLQGAGQAIAGVANYSANKNAANLERDEFNYKKQQEALAQSQSAALNPARQLLMLQLLARLGLSHNQPIASSYSGSYTPSYAPSSSPSYSPSYSGQG